jgi:uncharacterized protein (TIGR02246 family)
MKTTTAVMAGLLTLAAADTRAAESAEELKALTAVNQEFAAAIRAQDASKVGELYTEDALLMPPNESPLRGRAAVVAYFAGLLKGGKVDLALKSGSARLDGSLGYDAGQYRFELAPAGGTPVHDEGKYLVVLRKGPDGRWRMAVDTWNSDLVTR